MSRKKIDWIDILQRYVTNKPQRSAQEIDDETDKLFLNYI
jgi:serine/threonine-protein phosphatase 2A regulatory subunit B''